MQPSIEGLRFEDFWAFGGSGGDDYIRAFRGAGFGVRLGLAHFVGEVEFEVGDGGIDQLLLFDGQVPFGFFLEHA